MPPPAHTLRSVLLGLLCPKNVSACALPCDLPGAGCRNGAAGAAVAGAGLSSPSVPAPRSAEVHSPRGWRIP